MMYWYTGSTKVALNWNQKYNGLISVQPIRIFEDSSAYSCFDFFPLSPAKVVNNHDGEAKVIDVVMKSGKEIL